MHLEIGGGHDELMCLIEILYIHDLPEMYETTIIRILGFVLRLTTLNRSFWCVKHMGKMLS